MNAKNSIYHSLDVIEKRINEKLTVENIAADVYVSKFHYMRLFREVVGDSVMDYVNKRKLTLAATALVETNAKILDIALDYGFDSRDVFTRSFKAFMGITPAEYRKNGKNMILRKSVKEYKNMKHKNTTDTVINEINEWISLAQDIIKQIRQYNENNINAFWENVAEQTEILADNFTIILDQVNSISNNPDEISTGMDIVKTIDDAAFVANSIAFQIEMTEAKLPDRDTEFSFAEKYRKLAWFGVEKAKNITEFFRELLLLVTENMRITASKKIDDAVEKGKAVINCLPDDYIFIRDEIMFLIEMMASTQIDFITKQMLDDSLFKIKLITITAKLNINSKNEDFFDSIQIFSTALNDAVSFCDTIKNSVEDLDPKQKIIKIMQDIVFMENVLFFYTNGEMDYLAKQINKKDFDKIKIKIDKYKKRAFFAERDESDIFIFQDLAIDVKDIVIELNLFAENSGTPGGAIKVITGELERLTDKTLLLIEEIKKLDKS